jgi:hypothetical protein
VDSTEVHPDEFLTVKVNTPPARFVIVAVVPLPGVVNESGKSVIIHAPGEGSPFNTTLPDGTASVGWVIVPTSGAAGVGGCAGMTTLADAPDKQPSAVVTV